MAARIRRCHSLIANHIDVNDITKWSRELWTTDIMQGYTDNLKASKDGTMRFFDSTVSMIHVEKIPSVI